MAKLRRYENYILQLSNAPGLIIGFYGSDGWDSFAETAQDLNEVGAIIKVGVMNKERSRIYWYEYSEAMLPENED